MNRRFFLNALLSTGVCLCAGYAPRALAQPDKPEPTGPAVEIPAWKPVLGERRQWRVETEVGFRTIGGIDQFVRQYKAVRTQHMTVRADTPEGYSVLWERGSAEPADTMLATLMAIYRTSQIVIASDRAGNPLQLFGVDEMRARLASEIAAQEENQPQFSAMLRSILDAAQRDPLLETSSLANAAPLLGRIQRSSPWLARPGEGFELRQHDHLQGIPAEGLARFKVEAIDATARTARLSWTWDFAKEQLPPWARQMIDDELAKGKTMAMVLPAPLRTEAGSYQIRYSGEASISLDDGSLMDFEEKRLLRIGLRDNIAFLRAKRQ